jgi:hypothetical protein
MTTRKLQSLLAKWQKILRLQDWDVTIEFKRYNFFNGEYNVAKTIFREAIKSANVFIMADIDRFDANLSKDIELDVVHELIHLHTMTFGDEDYRLSEEQATEAMAKAFVGLDREKK